MMNARWRVIVGAIGMAIALGVPSLVAAQVRDFSAQGKFDPVGTGSIAGAIVTDDAQPRPLRRVVVNITEAATAIQPRTVTTDENGKFIFRGLPPGRYSVSATRAPYLTGTYGMKRIVGPGHVQTGTVIALGNGQQVADITIALVRGAVITGTIRDADGQPARGFSVAVMHQTRSALTGELTWTSSQLGGQTVRTDDRGMYRIFGLRPGTYAIAASGPSQMAADTIVTSDAEVARAMDALQRPGASAMIASPNPAVPTSSGTPAPRRPTQRYALVYFPGTVDSSQAATVTLAVAEEKAGVDFQMQFMATARIEGQLTGPDGALKTGSQVRAYSKSPSAQSPGSGASTISDPNGRFTLSGIAPGTYSIEARTFSPEDKLLFVGATEVYVAGDDRSVSISLQPPQTFSGRVVFDASTLKPPDVTKLRVMLSPVAATLGASSASGSPTANGEFTLSGVTAGRYRLSGVLPLPSIETGWYLKSATINGQDTVEVPVQIRPGEAITGAVITMTDRPTELSGTMTDANNAPAPEYFVIVFSADESHWVPHSSRIMQTRPSNDGSFVFRNLPPGDYRIAAVTDVQQGEWYDPAFLRMLVEGSIRLTLPEHGKIRQDIRIR